jgi:hypothetical protein
MTCAPNTYDLDAETKASGMGGKCGTQGTEKKYVPKFEMKRGNTKGNCDCVGYHSGLKMEKLECGLNQSDSETRTSIDFVCNLTFR